MIVLGFVKIGVYVYFIEVDVEVGCGVDVLLFCTSLTKRHLCSLDLQVADKLPDRIPFGNFI